MALPSLEIEASAIERSLPLRAKANCVSSVRMTARAPSSTRLWRAAPGKLITFTWSDGIGVLVPGERPGWTPTAQANMVNTR
jgi:hypothetical protein